MGKLMNLILNNKKIAFYILVVLAFCGMLLNTCRLEGKVQKLENKLLLERINKDQKRIIIEVIPKEINRIAPLPKDKAALGDKLYGGE